MIYIYIYTYISCIYHMHFSVLLALHRHPDYLLALRADPDHFPVPPDALSSAPGPSARPQRAGERPPSEDRASSEVAEAFTDLAQAATGDQTWVETQMISGKPNWFLMFLQSCFAVAQLVDGRSFWYTRLAGVSLCPSWNIDDDCNAPEGPGPTKPNRDWYK